MEAGRWRYLALRVVQQLLRASEPAADRLMLERDAFGGPGGGTGARVQKVTQLARARRHGDSRQLRQLRKRRHVLQWRRGREENALSGRQRDESLAERRIQC